MLKSRTIFSAIAALGFISNVVAPTNTCKPKTFSVSPLYNDLKPVEVPDKDIDVLKPMECSIVCHGDVKCTGFVYIDDDGVCSLYNTRFHAMAFVNKYGTRAYESTSGEPSDCYDVFVRGFRSNDLYTVIPRDGGTSVNVFCEMSSGGWLVIQRRTDGSEDFYRTWNEYRDGFGELTNEFWLGNTNIHRITTQGYYDLKIDLEDFEGTTRYALYKNFSLSSENDFFRLSVGAYSGDAGDSLSYHRGKEFSAKDLDVDDLSSNNCAQTSDGGWWYRGCHRSNLNGLYLRGFHTTYGNGINWYTWMGWYYSLKTTEMKIRPMHFSTEFYQV